MPVGVVFGIIIVPVTPEFIQLLPQKVKVFLIKVPIGANGVLPPLPLKYTVNVELLSYALEPFPLIALKVIVAVDPAQIVIGETLVTWILCAFTPTVKNESSKTPKSEIKILRIDNLVLDKHNELQAVLFLKSKFIQSKIFMMQLVALKGIGLELPLSRS